jgi:hypothetical protein
MEMTAPARQQDRSSWAKAAIRRMIGALRDVNDELVRAHTAMALPTRERRPGPGAGTTGGSAAATVGETAVSADQQASGAAAAGGSKPAA